MCSFQNSCSCLSLLCFTPSKPSWWGSSKLARFLKIISWQSVVKPSSLKILKELSQSCCFQIALIGFDCSSLCQHFRPLFSRNLFVPLFWEGVSLNLKGIIWGICCEAGRRSRLDMLNAWSTHPLWHVSKDIIVFVEYIPPWLWDFTFFAYILYTYSIDIVYT